MQWYGVSLVSAINKAEQQLETVILLEVRGKENAKDGPFLQSPFKAASHVISLNGETSHSPKPFTKLMVKFHIWKHQWNLTTTVS